MTIRYTCGCGKAFDLADNFAGKSVRCPNCHAAGTVPSVPIAPLSSPLSATPFQPMVPPTQSTPQPPAQPTQASAPHATTPLLELPNPYGGNAPRPAPNPFGSQPPPNSVWNAPSPLGQMPGQPPQVPAAYAKPQGLSTTARVLIGLAIVGGTLVVACCGGLALLFSRIDDNPNPPPIFQRNVELPPVASLPDGRPGRAFGTPPQSRLFTEAELELEEGKVSDEILAQILDEQAEDYQSENRLEDAIRCRYSAIMRGGGHRVELARIYAQQFNTNAALAWIEDAFEHEGVDLDSLIEDPSFKNIISAGNNEARLRERNELWQAYYRDHPVEKEELIVPTDYKVGTPIPVVIGLHGYGDNPHDFNIPSFYQDLADEKKIAFLIVSGSVTIGPKSFKWNNRRINDSTRIDRALKSVADRVTPAEGKLVTLGFSHGGMVAAHVPLLFPERYAGGIIMSPGAPFQDESLPTDGARAEHATQSYVLLVNAGEGFLNVQITKAAERNAREVFKAKTLIRVKEGENDHSFPSDYFDQLGTWIDTALSGRSMK